MENNTRGLKGIFEKITASVMESAGAKTKRDVFNLFPDITSNQLEEFVSNLNPDASLTERENLIKAILEGLGPSAYEAHLDHPDRDIRYVAQSLAYGGPVKSVRFDE